MSIGLILCILYGIFIGYIGVREDESILKIFLASMLGSFAISFWFN